jgi:hypothetical protein
VQEAASKATRGSAADRARGGEGGRGTPHRTRRRARPGVADDTARVALVGVGEGARSLLESRTGLGCMPPPSACCGRPSVQKHARGLAGGSAQCADVVRLGLWERIRCNLSMAADISSQVMEARTAPT